MTHSGGHSTERRASTRIDARVPIKVNPPSSTPVISGKTQDISPVGMRVRTEITPPFQIRDEVMFLVSEAYFKFQGQGEILWTSSPKGKAVGIKFTRLDEEARRSLEEFLSFFVDVPTSNR